MPFIGKQSSANSKIKKYSYTAEANQTNFAVVSGSGDELQVFFNGVKLKETDDYTYSTSQVTLGAGASAGDIVDIHVFSSFLIADAVSSSTGGPLGTGNNEWSLPVTRASENGQFLQMSDISDGTTTWASTVTDPSITGVTGHLNATEATGEGGGGTLVITGADLGTNISQVTDVSICNSSGGSSVSATTKSLTSSNTEITATWTGNESGYSTFTGVYYVKLTKSGKTSNIFNTTKSFSADPTISSVTGTGGEGESVTVSASDLGTYGGTIAGGGQDSNTKLLLNFDRTGGTDIEDSSNSGGNGHKVTANGNAVIKASPFGDGKSAIFFDGSDDDLELADSSDFHIVDNQAWTMELWFYNARTSGTNHNHIFTHGGGEGHNEDYWQNKLYHLDGTGLTWIVRTSNTERVNLSGGNLDFQRWYHIACVKNSSNVFKLFVDGVEKASATWSGTADIDGRLYFGVNQGGGGQRMYGYLDGIRLVNGSAVYASNFTPPTSRFSASDEANTKLLIHSNQTYDSSDSNHYVIASGAIPKSDQSKFGGSSWFFDGSDDHLEIAHNTDFDFGAGASGSTTNDFTIECWFRRSTNNSYQALLGKGNDTGNTQYTDAWFIAIDNSGAANSLKFAVNDTIIAGNVFTYSTNTWYHLALVRSENVFTFYINGTALTNTSTSTVNLNKTGVFYIGAGANAGAHELNIGGYIDDLRVTKGLAVYTGNFTAPTSALTKTWSASTGIVGNADSSKVKLLIHGDGAKFEDSATSGTTHTITPTGSYHSQAHGGIAPAMTWPASKKKTGSAGVYFDGNGDYLSIPTSTDFHIALDTSAYHFGTIEAYIYPTFSSGTGAIISSTHSSSQSSNYWSLKLVNGYLEWEVRGAGTLDITHSDAVIPTSTWTHVAVTRTHSGSTATYKIYVNGTEKGTGTSTSFASFAGSVLIGANNTGSVGEYFQGYIDHLRFRLGSTSSATVTPTASTLPTKIYGAMFPANPSVGTITITGATTDSTDIAFTEISSSLPNGLTLNDQGAGNQTATITGTLTDSVTSDTTTSNIRIQAKANNDAKRITEVNESSGTGNVSITKKAGGAPVLFNARRYVGSGVAPRDINGFGFKPDFIWIKERVDNDWHVLYDSVRGTASQLFSNNNNAQGTSTTQVTSFNSDGYTFGNTGAGNANGQATIAWAWKAGGAPSSSALSLSSGVGAGTIANTGNATAITQSVNQNSGLSITKFTGPSATADVTVTIPHNLGGTPEFIILKSLSNAFSWLVYHKDSATGTSNSASHYSLHLNSNVGRQTNDGSANDSGHIGTPTNSNIILSPGVGTNHNNYHTGDVIMYAFKPVSGVSAFGTYTGSGSSNFTAQNIGFRPRLLGIKCISHTEHWRWHDSFRGLEKSIAMNTSDSEYNDTTGQYQPTFTSSGFTFSNNVTHDGWNGDGKTYIFMAFA